MGKIGTPQESSYTPPVNGSMEPIVVDAEKIREQTSGEPAHSDDLSITNEALRMMPVKQYFGLDALNRDHDAKIKDIISWAKDDGSKNANMLYAKLRELEYKVGRGLTGDERIHKVWEYARIDRDIKSLVTKQEALYGGRKGVGTSG